MLTISNAMGQPYCVYAHYVDGALIYIGSGETRRAFDLRSRSKHHLQLLHSGNVEIAILGRHETRPAALKAEADMIRLFKPIANIRLGERQKRIRRKGPLKVASARPTSEHVVHIGKKSAAVLEILKSAASTNTPCPTNAEIAEKIGTTSYRVGDLVSSLAKRGMIQVNMVGPSSRVITVDGAQTQPTTDVNIKGIATMKHGRRVVDWIWV